MDIRVTLNSAFETVYLVNGRLVEGGEIFYSENEVVYITVLPLDAVMLPYTVKLVGGTVKCNGNLCKCYSLDTGKYHLKLSPRYNYIYSVPSAENALPDGLIEKFFTLVRARKLSAAREYLSRELNDSIDDASLEAFFDGFIDIIPAEKQRGLYFLINETGAGVVYRFVVRGTLIENIEEIVPENENCK